MVQNMHYHKRTDLPGTFNYEYMAAFLDGMKAVMDDLAGTEYLPKSDDIHVSM